jgi:hypothetical protein
LFFFLRLGGNHPADPSTPGWGDQYRKSPDGWHRDMPAETEWNQGGPAVVYRWRPEFQQDFARRLGWCVAK